MAEDDSEKTEKPTSRRREKAREEGQVAKSQEIGVAIAVFVLAIAISWILPYTSKLYLDAVNELLNVSIDEELTIPRAQRALGHLFWYPIVISGPVALLAMVMGTLANLLQVGVDVNWKNVTFKWSRLDPLAWLKRVFSIELVVNILKAFFKGLGVVIVAMVGLIDLPQKLWRLSGIPPAALAMETQDLAFGLAARVFGALLVLALLDVLWTRYRFEQKLMMSRQEVKDELKDSEGNPHMRGAIRRRMNEVSGRRLKDALSDATVVTTNPTHYAVALRYWRNKDSSPVVVAKGLDYKAKRIRTFAKELDIPIVEDKPLTRTLYSLVDEGQNVPVELYRSVARILAIVYRRKNYLSKGEDL